MNIVLFAVCALFGAVAMGLWAALASARVKLARTENMLATLFAIIQEERQLSGAERRALSEQVDALFEDAGRRRP